MARYHLGWEDEHGNPSSATGKRLRPALCLLACEAVGGEWRSGLPAAAAVELVHAFSLVHDDIQDRDEERHHRPAVWARWGEAQAINAGDALLVLAHLALAGLKDDAGLYARCAAYLDEATLEMVEGQVLDLEYEGRPQVTVDEWAEMVGKKTGALFGCALGLGAVTGGADEDRAHEFVRLGRALGTAFQARDDMLAIWGDGSRTGKPVASDLIRRKKSLPVVLAWSMVNEAGKAQLESARSEGSVDRTLMLFDGLGVEEECQREAERMQDRALEMLDRLELGADSGAELGAAVRFLLERDY
jgi:geranylgeranyl diphosphate synthase type I